jgi:phytoene/squalene synthetase
LVTKAYSTSFATAIRLLDKNIRQPIYNIYGFVRYADEIVDTFHDFDKATLLEEFTKETWLAIERGISLNPILNSFQKTVNDYAIPHSLIKAFLHSMELDLQKTDYTTTEELNEYIYGSAEVVGLMCLCVFCNGDITQYEQLKPAAKKLGAAFQKINFLRDLQADKIDLNRNYFPQLTSYEFNEASKKLIEADIEQDFKDSLEGIRKLPNGARFGVYTAYQYYYCLFRKIKNTRAIHVIEKRIRVNNFHKLFIVFQSKLIFKANLI